MQMHLMPLLKERQRITMRRLTLTVRRSLTLAKSIQSDLVKAIGTYNRGVKEQVFYVNRMNELPSVLVELAFISNPTEEAQLASAAFQKKAAAGIRKGLENYFKQ